MEFVGREFPIALTFDVDWAPDFTVQRVVSMLEEHNVPGTFFLTHQSPYLKILKNHPLVELGIHPNFLPNSTHGKTVDEVLDYVIDFCPEAISMRTHGLFQSSNLYFHILKKYPQIRYDFSLYIPENPYITPFEFIDDENRSLIRIPYQWEDDLFFLQKNPVPRGILFSHASYQIFDFHPIHVYLNSSCSKDYEQLKKNIQKPLMFCNEKEVEIYVNRGFGTYSHLLDLLLSTPKERFVFANQICGNLVQKHIKSSQSL